jgi:hypothetical protein
LIFRSLVADSETRVALLTEHTVVKIKGVELNARVALFIYQHRWLSLLNTVMAVTIKLQALDEY